MRSITVYQTLDGKYMTCFVRQQAEVWRVESYVIMSHEMMVAWIEQGMHPEYRYT
jgi:hypothetical protein